MATMAILDQRGRLDFAERRGRELGELLGTERGRREGREEGQKEGLRQGVEALCNAFGVELTADRRQELGRLPAEGLTALFSRLLEQKSWA
jgi:predicted transposase YdaD